MKAWVKAAIATLGIWGLSGTMIVDIDEVGLIYRFGALTRVANSGLTIRLPWPIEQDERLKVTEVKTVGLDKRLFLTGDANLVEASAMAQYTISNPINHATLTQNPDEMLKVILESALSSCIGRERVDPDSFINRSKLLTGVRNRTQEIVDHQGLGLRIESVELKELNAPSPVLDAFYEVSSARGDKETMILSAQSYSSKLLPDSRGKAEEIKEKAKAKAKDRSTKVEADLSRFNQLLELWQKTPDALRREILRSFWRDMESKIDTMVVSDKTELFMPNEAREKP